MMPAVPATSLPVTLFGAPASISASSFAQASGGMSTTASGASAALSGLGLPDASSLTGGMAVSAAPKAPFADLLTEAVGQVENYETEAKSAIEGLMTGKGVDVHQAMIATEKAEGGFELVLAVRNKALAAYQQVMGMQF